MTSKHSSLEKYSSLTLFKMVAKGLCVRGELETEQIQLSYFSLASTLSNHVLSLFLEL